MAAALEHVPAFLAALPSEAPSPSSPWLRPTAGGILVPSYEGLQAPTQGQLRRQVGAHLRSRRINLGREHRHKPSASASPSILTLTLTLSLTLEPHPQPRQPQRSSLCARASASSSASA